MPKGILKDKVLAMSEEKRESLSYEARQALLALARSSLQAAATKSPLPRIKLELLPGILREPAACFVTLYTSEGELRGCTGTLTAQMPLAHEVVHTTMQTAQQDPRFHPVTPREVDDLEIEISILTPPQRLDVGNPADLPHLIHPGRDGVILRKGIRRATFLPQVWERIAEPEIFLDMLCQKMGLHTGAWRAPGMEVEIYQVEKLSEKDMPKT